MIYLLLFVVLGGLCSFLLGPPEGNNGDNFPEDGKQEEWKDAA